MVIGIAPEVAHESSRRGHDAAVLTNPSSA